MGQQGRSKQAQGVEYVYWCLALQTLTVREHVASCCAAAMC